MNPSPLFFFLLLFLFAWPTTPCGIPACHDCGSIFGYEFCRSGGCDAGHHRISHSCCNETLTNCKKCKNDNNQCDSCDNQ